MREEVSAFSDAAVVYDQLREEAVGGIAALRVLRMAGGPVFAEQLATTADPTTARNALARVPYLERMAHVAGWLPDETPDLMKRLATGKLNGSWLLGARVAAVTLYNHIEFSSTFVVSPVSEHMQLKAVAINADTTQQYSAADRQLAQQITADPSHAVGLAEQTLERMEAHVSGLEYPEIRRLGDGLLTTIFSAEVADSLVSPDKAQYTAVISPSMWVRGTMQAVASANVASLQLSPWEHYKRGAHQVLGAVALHFDHEPAA